MCCCCPLATSGPHLLFRVVLRLVSLGAQIYAGPPDRYQGPNPTARFTSFGLRVQDPAKDEPTGSSRDFDLLVRSRPQSSLSLGFSGAGGAQPHMGKSKSCMRAVVVPFLHIATIRTRGRRPTTEEQEEEEENNWGLSA